LGKSLFPFPLPPSLAAITTLAQTELTPYSSSFPIPLLLRYLSTLPGIPVFDGDEGFFFSFDII
jgi:hypothetical protein